MGIAGTGMGAFARLLQQSGYSVQGSDQAVWPPMSDLLQRAGIEWMEGFVAENLDPPPDLVVVGNVIRRVNEEAAAMRERGLPHLSFPEALGTLFLESRRSLVVAGTHGKTTTTTMLAWLLESAGKDPSFLIGGVGQNFGDSAKLGEGPAFVLEGDEYDTAYFDKGPKFLHYRPKSLIFSSMEYDHADIYRDMDHYRSAFERLMEILPPDGLLAICANDPELLKVAKRAKCKQVSYSARPSVEAMMRVENIEQSLQGIDATVIYEQQVLGRVHLSAIGLHNLENALGAMVLALNEGCSFQSLQEGLKSFKGVRRRQELLGRPGGVSVIDDFAHHPTAVRETLSAVRAAYQQQGGEGRVVAVFEPRSNTARRNIYQAAYAEAFDDADLVYIASPPPHPDALLDSERFSPEMLVEALKERGLDAQHLPSADQILESCLKELRPGDVLLAMSNGAFGALPARLCRALEERAH